MLTALSESYFPADTSLPLLEATVADVLRAAATDTPDRIAIVEVVPPGVASLVRADRTDRTWTFAELLSEAEGCAQWLLERFEPGDRVCVWSPNVPEWIILQYGCALAGLVLVTANPALRANELAYALQQSRSAGLIHAGEFRGTDMSAVAAAARGPSPSVREMLCFSDWDENVRGYEGARHRLPDIKPGDAVQIQYTSGTTGNPKGALLHHRGLVNNASFVAARAGLDHGVLISPMPLFHTSGSSMSVLGTAATRSTYVLPLMFEPESLLAATEHWRGEVLFGVPTMMLAMLEHPTVGMRDLSSLRVALSGGAPVPAELLRRVEMTLGCDLISVYGQTEMSPVVSQTSPDDSVEDKAATSGRPLWHVEVKIASPTTGEILPLWQEGEICSRGYQRMLGYFEDPQHTAKTVDADGWLHSGDLGTLDERGYLRVTGRLKDLIIRGGENIAPAEIEARLFQHPAVADVAVFGLPDDRWGEVVAAAVRLADRAAPPAPSELKRHCRDTVAPQKAPERWFVVDEFPLTGSGKVQKFRLQELWAAGELEPMRES